MKYSLIITCEHAGNYVPKEYDAIFSGQDEILHSHRGWDPGAWDITKYLSEQMSVPTFGCFTTRLLVEVNRSLHHPQLFSQFTMQLNEDKKSKLLNNIYFPFRMEVINTLKKLSAPVLHLSVHSFTPVFNGYIRQTDIGILFDPERNNEHNFGKTWRKTLEGKLPSYNIQFNNPYQGIDDGFPTYLRTEFTNEQYLGIELEVNQKFIHTPSWPAIKKAITESLQQIIQ